MRLAFELSMEHPTLPRADALAALESEGVHVRGVSFSPEILVVDSVRPPRRAFERVALSRYVDRVLAIGPWPTIARAAARGDPSGGSVLGPFRGDGRNRDRGGTPGDAGRRVRPQRKDGGGALVRPGPLWPSRGDVRRGHGRRPPPGEKGRWHRDGPAVRPGGVDER